MYGVGAAARTLWEFDCEDNEKWKVWEDFVEIIINDEMIKQIDDSNEKVYTFQKSNDNKRVEE